MACFSVAFSLRTSLRTSSLRTSVSARVWIWALRSRGMPSFRAWRLLHFAHSLQSPGLSGGHQVQETGAPLIPRLSHLAYSLWD